MDFDELARKCRTMAYKGQNYEEIVQQTAFQKLSVAQQKELRALINDFIVQYQLADQVRSKHRTQIMLGGVAIFVGIFILLFTALRKENSYGIGIAALLIGLYIAKKGYDQYQQPIDFQNIIPKKDSKFRKY